MAQKRINDLQLRSSFDETCNFPSDDLVQTWRVSGAQVLNFIYSKLNDLSPEDILANDYIPFIDASDSNSIKKVLASGLRNSIYRSVTTTDSVGANDNTMVLSGASFISTLPTAVGVAGKKYKFIHGGTSITQVYTLATTSSQTIGGISSGDFALYTAGEVLEIESNGADWIILNHYAKTAWSSASYSTSDFTGFGTVTSIELQTKREGSDLMIRGAFTSGTMTATELRIALKLAGQSVTSKGSGEIPSIQVAGQGTHGSASTTFFGDYMLIEPSVSYLTVGAQTSTVNGLTKRLGSDLTSSVKYSFVARVPIAGWRD